MVVILSIVNGLASNMEDDIESHVAQVYSDMNKPETLNDILDASGAKFKLKDIDSAKEMKQAKKEILEGEADLIVEFPDNFRQEVEDYREGSKIPQVKTYQKSVRRLFQGSSRQYGRGAGGLPAVPVPEGERYGAADRIAREIQTMMKCTSRMRRRPAARQLERCSHILLRFFSLRGQWESERI